MRSELAVSMDLVASIGHPSGALYRLRRRASIHGTSPIEMYRLDSKDNWEYITTIGKVPT